MKFNQWLIKEDEQGFLAAIRKNPNDLDNWLVFADWLEERGDARSELIRIHVQCAVSRYRLGLKKNQALLLRADELLITVGNSIHRELALSFSQQRLALSLDTDLTTLAKIYNLMKPAQQSPRVAFLVLQQINTLLNGFGVESINDLIYYVNRGDTYDMTVVYEISRWRYLFTSWGNWYETN